MILRTSSDPDAIREVLAHLQLTLVAHISDAAPQGSASTGYGKQDLTTSHLSASESSEVISSGDQTYIVWQHFLRLVRPRGRLQKSAIYFSAALSLDSSTFVPAAQGAPPKDYLKPFQPLPRNVLEALNDAPEYRGKGIAILEDRLTRVVPKPVASKQDSARAIRGATKRAFPTAVALYSRVKYTTLPNETVIAALHLEASNTLPGFLAIDGIDVELECRQDEELQRIIAEDSAARGVEPIPAVERVKVRCLTEVPLPFRMGAGDETVLLYSITHEAFDKSEGCLSISISATLSFGLEINLARTWRSDVEIRPPSAEKAYRWAPAPSAQDGDRPSRTSSLPTPQRAPASGNMATVFTFTAPQRIEPDETFHLRVQCRNRSARSRSFIVGSVQRRRHIDAQGAAVFCRTPERKLGPVAVGSKADAAFEMRAIGRGAVDLGIVTIVDVDTGEKVEVGDLPDVVAVSRDNQGGRHDPV